MKNSKLVYYSIVVALAGFLFGFDTVVISGADKQLQNLWSSSDLFHGLVVMSSALWGTVLGSIFGAYPTNKWGRKKTLIFIGVLFFLSALGCAFANEPYSFAFFRFIATELSLLSSSKLRFLNLLNRSDIDRFVRLFFGLIYHFHQIKKPIMNKHL